VERPIFKPIGTPVEELDTPALVVDLDALGGNIETMGSFFKGRKASLRPHIESHRTPAIAHKQLTAGGTVGGICATTLGQAEVFAAAGFADILVASIVVGREKIRRLCALARHTSMTVAFDSAVNIHDLSKAASAESVLLDVVLAVATRPGRFGVEPGRPAVTLARAVRKAEGLRFDGLMTHDGPSPAEDLDEAAAASRDRVRQLLDTKEMVEDAGIEVRTVRAGGTYNYDVVGDVDGVTEVIAGSYALMDGRYRQHRAEFAPAARVLSTVGSVPEDGVAITDGGQKAIGADTGEPSLDGPPRVSIKSLSAEHGNLTFDPAEQEGLHLGDKVWTIPWDIGSCVNLHDYMHCTRNGRLEAVWEIPARGRYR
jgi:D-serine deaminase-like pyridoxal phosphate-dependent protein